MCVPLYILCRSLIVHFSMQVKHKPNGGITFPAFILGAGVVTNREQLDTAMGRGNEKTILIKYQSNSDTKAFSVRQRRGEAGALHSLYIHTLDPLVTVNLDLDYPVADGSLKN
jgi:hypothetical protein